jgi:hypothetical protein
MAFTPVRMASPDGRECLVGSATEREHLRARGYRIVTAPTPEPAPVKAEPKPAPKPVAKVEPADTKSK